MDSIMDAALRAVYASVEYKTWDRTMAVSVTGTIIFTIAVAVGLGSQIKQIWSQKSAEGLSVTWFTYFTGMFASMTIYGWHLQSIAMLFNCMTLLLLHLQVLLGIWRFKQWDSAEKKQAVLYLAAMPLAMAILPSYREIMIIIFGLGMICSAITQPWKMWREKKAGVLDRVYIAMQIASVSFWAIFAFKTGAVALMILNPGLFVIFVITLVLWYRYR